MMCGNVERCDLSGGEPALIVKDDDDNSGQ